MVYIDFAKALPAGYPVHEVFGRFRPYIENSLLNYASNAIRGAASTAYRHAMRGRGSSRTTQRNGGVRAVASAGPVSRSSFAYRYGRRGKIATDDATKTLESVGSLRISSGTGRQSNDSIYMFDRNDLNLIDAQWQGGSGTDNEYTVLRSSSMRIMITNQTQATGRFYIYDWVCRNSTDTTPATMWNDDLKEQFGETFDVANVIPHKPQQSPAFRYHYKIKSVKTIILEPGAVHEHNFICKANAILYQKGYIDGPNIIGGLTAGILVVTHGFPVNDSTTVSDITTCDIVSDLLFFKRLNSSYVTTSTKEGALLSLPDSSITPRTIMFEGGDVENVDAA